MDIDYLIIGQGIAGSLLSYKLMAAGKKVMVIDRPAKDKASLVAGAVINPLSGKNFSPAQHAALFIPEALACYKAMEQLLGVTFLQQTRLCFFPENEDQAYAFEQVRKSEASGAALRWLENRHYETYGKCFHARQGIGIQEPVWQVDAALLLSLWKAYLIKHDAYREALFDPRDIEIKEEGIKYKELTARAIIFCEGAAAAQNPFCRHLPFTRNRGDVLLLSIPGLPADSIYHRNLRLVPRSGDLFWCGSNYGWNFKDLEPDEAWRDETVTQLKQWLKIPFTIADHIVAERPTTAGQVPLVGMHPVIPGLAIFNGLGTRGFSSGPYWANELSKLLLDPAYTLQGYNKAWLDKHWKQ